MHRTKADIKKKEMESSIEGPLRPTRPMGLRNPVVDKPKAGDNLPYMFHQMPDLGFFTPRKVVLAVGMMRALPSLRAEEQTQEMGPPPVPQIMC